MTFPESALAHRYLDGLRGLEIGGAAHNPFGLKTLNVDLYGAMDTIFKQQEIAMCGTALPVDIVAPGDDLPFKDGTMDFVISSHVLEHFPNPLRAMREWNRVIRPGGYIFTIIPHLSRIPDEHLPRTSLSELIDRDYNEPEKKGVEHHYSRWVTDDVKEMAQYLNLKVAAVQEVDDKVGNGFTVVIQKPYRHTYHLHMPLSRMGNLPRLLATLEPLGIQWHPIIEPHENPQLPAVDWIHPMVCDTCPPGYFPGHWKSNWFMDHYPMNDNDRFISVNDDDLYEPGFFIKVDAVEGDLVISSMKRWGHPTLIACKENLKLAGVGGEQIILGARIQRKFRFGPVYEGDWIMLEKILAEHQPAFAPDAFALWNYLR